MASESLIADVLTRDYKISKFIDNWQRNRAIYADPALNNGLKQDSVQVSKYCTDGKDDGKISVKEKIGNFAKGIVAPVTNMFKSPKNFIKGLGAIALGAGLIYITGGAAAPVMVAAGVAGGGINIVKNAFKAKKAKTDKAAKEAWQGMGTGTTTVAISVAGAKSALKASGTEAAAVSKMSPLRATFECFKQTGKYGQSAVSAIKSHVFSSGRINKPTTNIPAKESPISATETPVNPETPVNAEVVSESKNGAQASTKPVNTPEETVIQLREAVKKHSEAAEEASSQLDQFTQEFLKSTQERTKGINGLFEEPRSFSLTGDKGLNNPDLFKLKK